MRLNLTYGDSVLHRAKYGATSLTVSSGRGHQGDNMGLEPTPCKDCGLIHTYRDGHSNLVAAPVQALGLFKGMTSPQWLSRTRSNRRE